MHTPVSTALYFIRPFHHCFPMHAPVSVQAAEEERGRHQRAAAPLAAALAAAQVGMAELSNTNKWHSIAAQVGMAQLFHSLPSRMEILCVCCYLATQGYV